MPKTYFYLIIILLILFLNACGSTDKSEATDSNQTVATEQTANNVGENAGQDKFSEAKNINPLTGEKFEKAIPLTAVMIGNNPEARPQSGLNQANIVYEVEAEGMITRYMALFYGDPPDNAGPVRSARPYFLMLAKEWDSYYVHVGGSNEAQFQTIPQWKIPDIDDMRGDKGFELDNSRQRPNKTFFDFQKGLTGKQGRGNVNRWKFLNDWTEQQPDNQKFSLRYGSGYKVSWRWDNTSKYYLRFLNDKPYMGSDNQQISAKNVIVQYVKHQSTNDKEKHIKVNFIGQGKAEYFLGGKYYTGKWVKKDLQSVTEFLLEDGTAIKLAQGNIWIQVQRPEKEVTKG